jgi:hypothetical protein
MLSTAFATVPAGVLGSGSVVARPYACADVRPWSLPPVAAVPGTAVPSTGMARRRGADLLIGFQTTALPTTQHDPITQNDGTTLGIHPRGRSTS